MNKAFLKVFGIFSVILVIAYITITLTDNSNVSPVITNNDSNNTSKFNSINLYTNGVTKELSQSNYKTLSQLITNKILNVNGQLRIVMSEEEINKLKEKSTLLEIITNKEEVLNYLDSENNNYKITYDKIFILLSDATDFSNDANHIIITSNSANKSFQVLKTKEDSSSLLSDLKN